MAMNAASTPRQGASAAELLSKALTPALSTDTESSPLLRSDASSKASTSLGDEEAPGHVAANAKKEESMSFIFIALKAIFLASVYISLSTGMIMFNKHLMAEELFPFPIFLTSLHMLSATTFASILRFAAPSFFPTLHIVFKGQDEDNKKDQMDWLSSFLKFVSAFTPFWGIAACMVVSLAAGNTAYKFASVSFLQMIKEGHVVIVYFMMVVFGLDVFKVRILLVVCFVGGMSALAIAGSSAAFSLAGLILQMLAGFAGATQMVLTNRMMAKSTKLDPMTMVLCTAPACLLFFLPLVATTWDTRVPSRLLTHAWMLVGSCLLAFSLQISTVYLIKGINAIGHALASVTKDLMIVALATVFMGDHLTICQISGFAGAVAGIFLYSYMKLFPEQFEVKKVIEM
eukprot:gnl/TRDRNA2_/TRDRNA2_178574_c0_seq1.p1 gnl/TRDRNA2_/TRDRNA2_178574_c0~~gnl/TRDRNA2_/TRDRNA2_178574_c0_seq1.p1  ORF type:complete len:401 (-),score=80.14 gnl/TRDRNA2_/TRDRNA2_178574_c0_seq1:53-1255(-)